MIRLSKSFISHQEKEAVSNVLDKEYLGMGEEVNFFEKEIKEFLNTEKDVICVNTGTSALHLSLMCLDIGIGDEVIVPSLTYVSTYQAISATGAKPVSCDIRENDLFIDLKDVKLRLTDKTKAIMPVHYASNSVGMDEIYSFANENNLTVIEDAAHSFGCLRNGKKIGVDGDIVCFSFDGIKNITSGEGGAILSDDKNFIQRVQDARLLGVEKDTEKRFARQRSWDFDVKYQGLRYHMSNIMAAIGREQLKKIDHIKNRRQEIAANYIEGLKMSKDVELLDFDFKNIIPHIFVIKAKNRDSLKEFLMSNGIECGIHYKPNHLLSKFMTSYSLPVVEKLYSEILSIPCHPDLTVGEQDFIIDKINEFYKC